MLPDLPWTHSIADILNYIDNYIKIINYYENKFPNKVLSIQLENFTNRQEFYTKKIYEFCNLSWSPEILEFYKKKNFIVKTLSNTQLRSQISTYNYKQYQPYQILLNNFKNKYAWLTKD